MGFRPLHALCDLPNLRSWAPSLLGLIPSQPQGYNLLLPAGRIASLCSVAATQNASAAEVRRGWERAGGGGPWEQSPSPYPEALSGGCPPLNTCVQLQARTHLCSARVAVSTNNCNLGVLCFPPPIRCPGTSLSRCVCMYRKAICWASLGTQGTVTAMLLRVPCCDAKRWGTSGPLRLLGKPFLPRD